MLVLALATYLITSLVIYSVVAVAVVATVFIEVPTFVITLNYHWKMLSLEQQ